MHRTVFGLERNETVDDDNIADDQKQKWKVHRNDNKGNYVRSLKSEKTTMDLTIVPYFPWPCSQYKCELELRTQHNFYYASL